MASPFVPPRSGGRRPIMCRALLGWAVLSLLIATAWFDSLLPSSRETGLAHAAETDEVRNEPQAISKQADPTDGVPACARTGRASAAGFFAGEVWAKVGESTCLKCHVEGGDAADSEFVLRKPSWDGEHSGHNLAAFAEMAAGREQGNSRLLLKVTGGLDHGGGAVLAPDSTAYRILERLVEQLQRADERELRGEAVEGREAADFFDGMEMLSDQRLLRRVTLSLAARLPAPEEVALVEQQGLDAFAAILDRLMQEDAFYERLVEGFNDIFLTQGYDGVADRVLSYEHFGTTRHWTQTHDLSHLPEEEQTKARYALTDDYRTAIRREPLELIAHIVRTDRPFTELVTADYIMLSPYTARGYGIFEELRERFADPDDPFEYIPVRLKALQDRSGRVQESATGYYPHSGFLSLFHYLRRYPTTETNRNRLRARMYYQHFLGIDIMELAPTVTDAAAVDAQFKYPTLEAADCVVCHKVIDPVAGLFQHYNDDGYFGPRRDGWYEDMFQPGFEGQELPDEDRWRPLQWLGQQTAEDPRFAVAMVEHVYYLLMGRRVLLPPQDIDDPLFASRRRAYWAQREMIQEVAERFVQSGFDLKQVFQALVVTPFYRVDGLSAALNDPCRQAELEDIGVVRLLSPEQLQRKLLAIFGQGYGRLTDQFSILYGGINSSTVTERLSQPSGAMGAIQRMMANEMACQSVAKDFTTEAAQRHLFPGIEPDVLPGGGPEAEARIRQAIVHLHGRLLGQEHPADHPEVERTYRLFAGILAEAHAQDRFDSRESYFCKGKDDQRVDDPHYTLRAWRAVVTYLLRQHDFLYE